MTIHRGLPQLFLIICTCFIFVYCGKKGNNDGCMDLPYGGAVTYTGSAPMHLTPTRDTFSIGDTIWIEMDIPPTIFDEYTQDMINITEVEFKNLWGSIVHLYYDTLNQPRYYFAAHEFSAFSTIGDMQIINSLPSFVNFEYHLDSTNQHRVVRGGIIPLRSGLFSVGASTQPENVTRKIGNYCEAHLELLFAMNENIDSNNYHLLAPFGVDLVGTFEQYQSGARYSFVVE